MFGGLTPPTSPPGEVTTSACPTYSTKVGLAFCQSRCTQPLTTAALMAGVGLRILTLHPTSDIEEHIRAAQRFDKVLHDAGVKLSSVTSSVLTKSGREMLDALIVSRPGPHCGIATPAGRAAASTSASSTGRLVGLSRRSSPRLTDRKPLLKKGNRHVVFCHSKWRYWKCNGFNDEVPQSLPSRCWLAREGPNAAGAARLSPELAQGVHFRSPGVASERGGRPKRRSGGEAGSKILPVV